MIRLSALLGSLLLVLTAVPVSAQYYGAPGGSYQQSCTNIRVHGNRLHANCSAPNGARVGSSIPLPCRGDIANSNGYLQCNGGSYGGPGFGHRPGYGPGYGGLPAGSYQGSCVNARMQGTMLFANCSAPNGARVGSSINVQYCRGDIANRNGYLNCER